VAVGPTTNVVSLITVPGAIAIPHDSGEEDISVDIPDIVRDSLPLDTSLHIIRLDPNRELPENSNIGSSAVDLTLMDGLNRPLQFKGEIELCFTVVGNNAEEESCLGYLDEECGQWVCEDKSLESKEGKVCGTTGHFSSFAILIGANLRAQCGSQNQAVDDVLSWLSLALGMTAIIIVLVCMAIKEFKIRRRRARIESQFGRSDVAWRTESERVL